MAFQAKELERALLGLGVDMTGLSIDVGVAVYLLDPSTGQYNLERVSATYLGVGIESAPKTTGQMELDIQEDGSTSEDPALAAGRMAVVVGLLGPVLTKRLSADGLERLHDEIERPLERVLARMEIAGIAVDTDELRLIAADLKARCKSLEGEIHELQVSRSTSTPPRSCAPCSTTVSGCHPGAVPRPGSRPTQRHSSDSAGRTRSSTRS